MRLVLLLWRTRLRMRLGWVVFMLLFPDAIQAFTSPAMSPPI